MLSSLLSFGLTASVPRPPPENVVGLDLGLHVVGIAYQRKLTPWLSGQIAVDPYLPWTQNLHLFQPEPAPQTDVAGLVLRHRAFFHPLRTAPAGFWISPFVQYGLVLATRAGEPRWGGVGAAGLSLGYSFLIARAVHLTVGAGAQFHAANVTGGVGSPSFAGFYPHLDLGLGYAF